MTLRAPSRCPPSRRSPACRALPAARRKVSLSRVAVWVRARWGAACTIAIVAGLLTGFSAARADEAGWRPAGFPTTGDGPTAGDARLASVVEAMLRSDPLLGELNLGVTVEDHVATLWGPVPSADLGRRAQDLVRRVDGVADVKNDLRLAPEPADHGVQPSHPRTGREDSPPACPPRWVAAGTRQADGIAPDARRPVPAAAASRPVAGTATPGVVLRQPVQLLAPVPLRSADVLAQAILRVRTADPRFAAIECQVDAGIVRLSGAAPSWEAAYALARAVAALPGVQRVVLEGISVSADRSRKPGPETPAGLGEPARPR